MTQSHFAIKSITGKEQAALKIQAENAIHALENNNKKSWATRSTASRNENSRKRFEHQKIKARMTLMLTALYHIGKYRHHTADSDEIPDSINKLNQDLLDTVDNLELNILIRAYNAEKILKRETSGNLTTTDSTDENKPSASHSKKTQDYIKSGIKSAIELRASKHCDNNVWDLNHIICLDHMATEAIVNFKTPKQNTIHKSARIIAINYGILTALSIFSAFFFTASSIWLLPAIPFALIAGYINARVGIRVIDKILQNVFGGDSIFSGVFEYYDENGHRTELSRQKKIIVAGATFLACICGLAPGALIWLLIVNIGTLSVMPVFMLSAVGAMVLSGVALFYGVISYISESSIMAFSIIDMIKNKYRPSQIFTAIKDYFERISNQVLGSGTSIDVSTLSAAESRKLSMKKWLFRIGLVAFCIIALGALFFSVHVGALALVKLMIAHGVSHTIANVFGYYVCFALTSIVGAFFAIQSATESFVSFFMHLNKPKNTVTQAGSNSDLINLENPKPDEINAHVTIIHKQLYDADYYGETRFQKMVSRFKNTVAPILNALANVSLTLTCIIGFVMSGMLGGHFVYLGIALVVLFSYMTFQSSVSFGLMANAQEVPESTIATSTPRIIDFISKTHSNQSVIDTDCISSQQREESSDDMTYDESIATALGTSR